MPPLATCQRRLYYRFPSHRFPSHRFPYYRFAYRASPFAMAWL